jgi:hypothetical protein
MVWNSNTTQFQLKMTILKLDLSRIQIISVLGIQQINSYADSLIVGHPNTGTTQISEYVLI